MSHESIPFSTAVSNCRIDATHRKGRIEKWQPRKQPRSQRRKPRSQPRRPRKRSNGLNKQKRQHSRGTLKSVPLSVWGGEKIRAPRNDNARNVEVAETRAGKGDSMHSTKSRGRRVTP